MVTAVRSRASHYETLGLTPSATGDEIRKAFARMMGMFGAHPVAAATSVSAAFEVLRDPDRRREYDRRLGLLPEPAGSSSHWRVAGVGWSSPGLIGSAWAAPAEQKGGASNAPAERDPPAERETPVEREPAVERAATVASDLPVERESTQATQGPPVERRLASFISSSLRDLARPVGPQAASAPKPQVEAPPPPAQEPSADVEADPLPVQRADAEIAFDAESAPLDLRRPALIALAAVAAAGLVGALAGASAADQEQPSPPKRGVTVTLPAAAPEPNSGQAREVLATTVSATPTQASRRDEAAAAVLARDKRAERQRIALLARTPAGPSQLADSALTASSPVDAVDAQADAGSGAPKAVAASMPLPGRVIARTIDRIGYSCGTVVSTTAVESAGPGVYKVACSSGQSFQARPVGGRYRFRRQ